MLRINPNMSAFAYDDVDENGKEVRRINIEHAEIPTGTLRDFAGIKSQFGTVSFNITIPAELEEVFTNEGVNVSHWLPADATEDEEPNRFVSIKINYSYWKQPDVEVAVGSDGQFIPYSEADVRKLGDTRFEDAGFIVNVHHGVTHGNPYTALYIHRAWLTIKKNEHSQYEQDMIDRYSRR